MLNHSLTAMFQKFTKCKYVEYEGEGFKIKMLWHFSQNLIHSLHILKFKLLVYIL